MTRLPGLTDRVAGRLLEMIATDPAYTPGARLPGETRLCQLFGVSRTTLREAVRSLAARGYLEVRRGSGTFVLDRGAGADIDLSRLELAQVRLRDLFEIRMMIEPQAARLACIRGTDREIQEIARRAGAVAQAIQTGADFTDLEEAFHRAVAAAAHNQFMEQLMPIIHNALHEAWAASAVTGCLAQLTLQDNRQLMDFFRRRDGEGAQHAMAAHIRHTINVLDL
ncbi:MAG TPA: FadR family transcriptional regulator [Candidatus Faecousia faecigallinarum]|nr:FadR family transcriptional regulator [Candidatus Faecousia faecigallinarum]